MLLSIFGQVEYGNYGSIMDWAAAHDQAHRTLSRAAAGIGVPIPPGLLTGEHIDNDWLGRHGLIHLALGQFIQPNSSTCNQLMVSGLSEWTDEGKFYSWMEMHDSIHSLLNQYFGVTT